MQRRSVRVLILMLTVGITAAGVWRATTAEQARGRARLAEQQVDAIAADAVYALADLRATLHAYVAPGQGLGFWSARAEEQLGRIRTLVAALDEPATAARYALTRSRETLNRLADAEALARAHARDGHQLLAGDLIFTEIGGQIDEIAADISGARQALARAASAREAGTANAQSLVAGGLLSIWIVALILLVPLPRHPEAAGALSVVRPDAPAGPVELGADAPAPTPDHQPRAETPPGPLPADLDHLAGLCRDLGAVADARDLEPLMARAADLLGARGMMVWVAQPGGTTLTAAAASGYDPNLIDRIGPIGRDDDNLTAAAFRTGAPARSVATPNHPAAVAVPLLSASGPSGVLAAELRPGAVHDLGRAVALAGILAAQLASLFPAPANPVPQSTPAQA